MENNPRRKPNRLKTFDYSAPGAYFITICTDNRRNLFWENVGASIARPMHRLYRRLWLIKTVLFPSDRVMLNILPYFPVVCLAADHMIMKQFLPNATTNLFGHISFHLLHNSRNGWGWYSLSVAVCTDLQKQMDVIGHDNIMIHRYCRIVGDNTTYSRIHDFFLPLTKPLPADERCSPLHFRYPYVIDKIEYVCYDLITKMDFKCTEVVYGT